MAKITYAQGRRTLVLYLTFVDIAVGAPFEEEGRGSVYIYNGYKLGLWSRSTQRITAAEIDKGIRTFGISFSRPYDVDQNGYTGNTNVDI